MIHISDFMIHNVNGDPERARTSDLELRRLSLYPAELRGRVTPCFELSEFV